ncbi:protein MpRLK-Pelle_WAK5 [Marchantia polymorpha subsp. ruderalis]|uniref:Protein kinase domain-containing protein n=2 Tax=Marchantia polymorpha TaxID=3197 RepID=A0AAF6BT93_MARPO|nr:hypothetical protein MARPO_0038s0019 [Marchantia polymorpha]BBN15227.1 hypothetical protein Mp_6g18090 [Marchantia polymorpha subsp. ruderalis]|eukprot:PTQ40660.1 hypothetical protein MARPO_0038s0019 [Marchantia polymorpha]
MGCWEIITASLTLDAQSPYWISEQNVFIVVSCNAQGSAVGDRSPWSDGFSTTRGPVSCVNQFVMPYCSLYDCCIQTIGATKTLTMTGEGIGFAQWTNCGFSTVLYPESFGGGGDVGVGHYGFHVWYSIQRGRKFTTALKLQRILRSMNAPYPQLDFRGNNCTRIDQCKNTTKVCSPDAQCTFDSSSGDLNCTCQGGTFGDGRVKGTGCTIKETSNLPVIIGVSVGSVIAFIIINSILLWYFFRRRRLAFDPAIFSQQELLNEIENKEGAKYCKLFTFSELREATKDFSVELGAGGFGTVFEGTLRDGTKVAIKKAKHGMGETRHEAKQFVNEIVILSQLNHRNLVNLLGCCLETRVPVLVYEFVSNGNLHEHIQMTRPTEAQRSSEALVDDNSYFCHPPLNWTLRLKIAIETAEALAYLHWGTSPPVYHRDVKCANILLDDTHNVKVADFGLSKLVPLEDTDAYAVPTAIQGTPGYMDPGLLDQYELTDKSDVYSYGVLLLVILTGQRPVDLKRQPKDQNLVNRCDRLMTQGLFADIIDPELSEAVENPDTLEAIDAVAKLALKCVSRDGQDRPTMKEVASELHTIREKTKTRTSVSKMVKSLTKKVTFSKEYSMVPLDDGQLNNSYYTSTSSSTLGLPWSETESSQLSSSGLSEFELSKQERK